MMVVFGSYGRVSEMLTQIRYRKPEHSKGYSNGLERRTGHEHVDA